MALKSKGAIYIFIAAVLWSFGGLGAKFIPWSALPITCVRGTVAAVTIMCIRRKWRVKLNKATILAALCMTATTLLFMFANKLTTSANAIVFQYTSPIYVILASIFILKLRPRTVDIVTVLLSIAGISLFFIDHLGHGKLLGDSLALLSGITYAGVFFFNTMPGADPQEASFLGCVASALFLPTLFMDPQVAAGGAVPWIVAIALGVFQLGLAYYFFAKGVQETGAIASSVITSIEPILNPIWVFLAVGERPGALSILGAFIVIFTICAYNVLGARKPAADTEQV